VLGGGGGGVVGITPVININITTIGCQLDLFLKMGNNCWLCIRVGYQITS